MFYSAVCCVNENVAHVHIEYSEVLESKMQQLKLRNFIYMIHDGTDVLSYVICWSQCWLSSSSCIVLIIDLDAAKLVSS